MNDCISEDIRDTFDAAMKSYIDSDEKRNETKSINEEISSLRSELTKEQQIRLNKLIDDIDNHNNGFALEAYERGWIQGIAFCKKYDM